MFDDGDVTVVTRPSFCVVSSVDQPLEVMRCPETSKEFLLCDYNRDGDSYRFVIPLSHNIPRLFEHWMS